MKELSEKIAALVEQARLQVAKVANSAMVFTYFQIGKMIVEELQNGEKRAEYGTQLLETISTDLKQKFKKGFSVQNLERMRVFYSVYSISSNELRNSDVFLKSSNALRISTQNNDTTLLLPISWSHYLFLLKIENELERQFYEVKSLLNHYE